MTKKERTERKDRFATAFRQQFAPGMHLHFELVNRSRSGMRRYYKVFTADATDGNGNGPTVRFVTNLIGVLTDSYDTRSECVIVDGCGFSGSQHVVESLQHALGGEWNAKGAFRYDDYR